jgi:hypothetical protein
MTIQDELQRAQAKTGEQRFKYTLEQDFHYAPRIAEAIVAEAQDCLSGVKEGIQVGQMCVLLARQGAANGRAMRETELVCVVWTVDAGSEDAQVAYQHGVQAMRQQRILRLLDEAVEQGAAASQEDLAPALHSSVRTIKRDCAVLQAIGYYLPTRGHLEGVGRGQTHKAQIIRRWLSGESYDQIALHTRHSAKSIQRYIKAFEQVVLLQRQGLSQAQMAQLLQIGLSLVQEYLAVYEQNDRPECRQRLEEQLERISQGKNPKKGGQ